MNPATRAPAPSPAPGPAPAQLSPAEQAWVRSEEIALHRALYHIVILQELEWRKNLALVAHISERLKVT